MPGDLNAKKQFHPGSFANREKVWKAEKELEEKERKVAEWRAEIEKERRAEDLKTGPSSMSVINKPHRLDWMYAGPHSSSDNSNGGAAEYLLGKKLDSSFMGARSSAKKALEEQAPPSNLSHSMNSTAPLSIEERDTQHKQREDPMFLIKQAQQQKLMAMLASRKLQASQQGVSNNDAKAPERVTTSSNYSRHTHTYSASEQSGAPRGSSSSSSSRFRDMSPSRDKRERHSRDRSRSRSPRRYSRDRHYRDRSRSMSPRRYSRDNR